MTRQRSSAISIVAIAGLLLVGAGCSSSVDKGSSATSDTVTSTTSDNATSDTSGGPTSSGGSGRLPAGVPAGIAMPEGVELGPWEESTRDGKRVLTIVGTIPDAEGHGPAIFEWITAQLVDMGYSVEDSTEGEANGRYRATVSGVTDDHSVQVTVTDLAPDIRVDYEVLPGN